MLFVTRGSTDLAMQSTLFATPGVDNFLEGAIKIYSQDFIAKLEGFALQGVVGSAKNHQQRVASTRANIRGEILDKLSASANVEHIYYLI